MGRQPNGRPTIYKGADGLYHTWVTVGTKDNGEPLRKHIKRKTAEKVAEAVDELQQRMRQSSAAATGKIETVGQWITHYLDNIVKPDRTQNTWDGYRSLFETHIIPAIGHRRLAGTRNVLEPEHLDEMYKKMRKTGGRGGKGLADSSVLKAHRILSRALDIAVRRGKATRNVCDLRDAPTARRRKPEGYDLDDAKKLLAASAGDRLEARWLLGLVLGQRQGEALGVRWPRLKLTAEQPYVMLPTQIQRQRWQHGCDDPVDCARPRCRTKPCGPSWSHGCADVSECKKNPRWCPLRKQRACRLHNAKRGCPPPCKAGCIRHGSRCPQRVDGGLVEVDVKTERRAETPIPVPPHVVAALERRRQEQMREAQARGQLWDDQGLVFTELDGRPIDPRQDYDAWHELGRRAEVPKQRLHAARHTAASLLIATGTELEVVQEILGHTDIRMTRGYVEVAKELKAKAVNRLAAALFDGNLAALLQPNDATTKAQE